MRHKNIDFKIKLELIFFKVSQIKIITLEILKINMEGFIKYINQKVDKRNELANGM